MLLVLVMLLRLRAGGLRRLIVVAAAGAARDTELLNVAVELELHRSAGSRLHGGSGLVLLFIVERPIPHSSSYVGLSTTQGLLEGLLLGHRLLLRKRLSRRMRVCLVGLLLLLLLAMLLPRLMLLLLYRSPYPTDATGATC